MVRDGIVAALDPATVRRLLDAVDLPPHRTRFGRTARRDDQVTARADKGLWCDATAARRARRGVWVVCGDARPNLQVLERTPIRRAIPGAVAQRAFEDVRHGTVNLLTLLVVHTGVIRLTCLAHNDSAGYDWALRQFRADSGPLRGVSLIDDGGPSHGAAATGESLSSLGGGWHSRRTPAQASWRHQSELLNNAVGGRSLNRGSGADRGAFVEHVRAAGLEYHRRFASPFAWTWTNPKRRAWFARHST